MHRISFLKTNRLDTVDVHLLYLSSCMYTCKKVNRSTEGNDIIIAVSSYNDRMFGCYFDEKRKEIHI